MSRGRDGERAAEQVGLLDERRCCGRKVCLPIRHCPRDLMPSRANSDGTATAPSENRNGLLVSLRQAVWEVRAARRVVQPAARSTPVQPGA